MTSEGFFRGATFEPRTGLGDGTRDGGSDCSESERTTTGDDGCTYMACVGPRDKCLVGELKALPRVFEAGGVFGACTLGVATVAPADLTPACGVDVFVRTAALAESTGDKTGAFARLRLSGISVKTQLVSGQGAPLHVAWELPEM